MTRTLRELSDWHNQLHAHFSNLSALRSGAPIFALEHGLDESDLDSLKSGVKRAIGDGHNPGRGEWLTIVVYAAELGYRYSGDEYWHTFEEETPGWADCGDRHAVRNRFSVFAREYRGAVPSGRWAEHFSIICWPITHAVLPTDLQRHLARLLFDYRGALSDALLSDPGELGRRLAGRAWNTSSRFRNFAQNTDLLGQVAVALLADEEDSPLLLAPTLHRIVGDLSAEREARHWLGEAKRTAVRVRTRGFSVTSGRGQEGGPAVERTGLVGDPRMRVRRDPDGWSVSLVTPDLLGLERRLPGLYHQLESSRCIVAGVSRPLARGRVLFPGRTIPLESIPSAGQSLFQLERGTEAAQRLLADQAVLAPSPWLFRIADSGEGFKVRGKTVRPGGQYLLVTTSGPLESYPGWTFEVPVKADDALGYEMTIPEPIGDESIRFLQEAGLSIGGDLAIRPIGFCASDWDGEGYGEWVAGESPMVGIASDRIVSQCVVSIDGMPRIIEWPEGEKEVFLRLTRLDVGIHNMSVRVRFADSPSDTLEGQFTAAIRATRDAPGGSLSQGLMLLSYPPHPTLSELWEGRGTVEILGPEGVSVSVSCGLLGRRFGERLALARFSVRLPVDAKRWSEVFAAGFRGNASVRDAYDEAEVCVVDVTHPVLGQVSLRSERVFSPIRLHLRETRDQRVVKVIDNTEAGTLTVEWFDFAAPGDSVAVDLIEGSAAVDRSGGLIRATSGDLEASMIVPPVVRALSDLPDLRRIATSSRLRAGPRSVDSIVKLLDLSQLWTAPALPGDPFARYLQIAVRHAITARTVGVICGTYWWDVEKACLDGNEPGHRAFVNAMGRTNDQVNLGEDLLARVDDFARIPPEDRGSELMRVIDRHLSHGIDESQAGLLGELLLRLASAPDTLCSQRREIIRPFVEVVLEMPILLRAARLVVLTVHFDAAEDQGIPYGGWLWS